MMRVRPFYLRICMSSHRSHRSTVCCLALWLLAAAAFGFAGVFRSIQDQYKKEYENKAMILKIPVYAEKQLIQISGQSFRIEPGAGSPRFKVGDQLRILLVDFASDEIRFRLGGIAMPGTAEIGFKFDADLQQDFPNRDVFDRALQATLTEGLKYSEIDEAKRTYLEGQFERSVREMAGSASMSPESVLKGIAPFVPAYQDAQRDIENLKNRMQDVTGQLAQAQSEKRKLEAESKAQQAEIARLKAAHAALQEKIDSSAAQVSRLGEELRDARGTAQGYQKELASIQRSLNLKVDAGRDLTQQIADLGQALRRLQKENDALGQRAGSLQTGLDAQKAVNERLLSENEELKAANRKMKITIDAITSKGDSLARQYLNLKSEKEKLDDFSQSVRFVSARVTEERTEAGMHIGKAAIYLRSVPIGSLNWSIPTHLSHNQSKSAEAAFSAESIDSVRLTPEERQVLRTFGERLKIRLDLASRAATMTVTTAKDPPVHEIGVRDGSLWQWSVLNQGIQDSRLVLTARLINRNAQEIPVFQKEHPVMASNAIRQVRNYLQPVPLVLGIILGFLLFGIVGIFRRHKTPKAPILPSAPPSAPHAPIGKKKL